MQHHFAILTTFGIEKLQLRIDQLKERHEHITQDLKDKTQGHNILAIKSIEKEIIFSDMVKMSAVLSNARVVKQSSDPVCAEQGIKVSYRQADTGTEHTVTLVDPIEADPIEGFVSIESPVGSALLGHQIDDTLVITTPRSELHLTITRLES